eukprot:TRINITY_DN69719_c0_g1_i1.p1 TRINITY_DN69719_c0_g1~~TRINITY_DN69719_c0_g1_i1.p1  ORF type:complete len:327 (+),score=39.08 TRINITY_DN69719_c0_g1_i1:63-1043(+)
MEPCNTIENSQSNGVSNGSLRKQLQAQSMSCPDEEGDDSAKASHYIASKRPREGDGAGEDEPPEKRHSARLEVVGDRAPEHACWIYCLKDERRRCFAGHLKGALPKGLADHFYDIIHKETPWKRSGPRWTAWMVKPPCTCIYGYKGPLIRSGSGTDLCYADAADAHGGTVSVAHPSMWPDWMDDLLKHIMPLCGIDATEWPNSCNMNCYDDGWDGIGWHSDEEPLFQGTTRDCLIVSLSLGQAREFTLCPNEAWDPREGCNYACETDWDGQVSMTLGHGDLCSMEGMTQKFYRHAAPQCETDGLTPRLNLTWRWIVQHEAACELGK